MTDETREQLLHRARKNFREVRQAVRNNMGDLNKLMDQAQEKRGAYELTKVSADKISKKLVEGMRDSIDDASGVIRSSMEKAVKEAVHRQGRFLEKLGLPRATPQELKEIQKKVLLRMEAPFSTDGLNQQQRFERILDRHRAQTEAMLRKEYVGPVKGIAGRDIKNALTYSAPGRAPVPGGSLVKDLQRLQVGEEGRARHEAEKTLLQERGVELVYWHLSPNHNPKHCGGGICDRLAGQTNERVIEFLAENNLGLDPAGLYFVEDLPEYPHPSCWCFLEPVRVRGAASAAPMSVPKIEAPAVVEELGDPMARDYTSGSVQVLHDLDGGINGAQYAEVQTARGAKGACWKASSREDEVRTWFKKGTLYKRERATHLFDQMLEGEGVVPLTVIRDVPGQGIGSLQHWVEGVTKTAPGASVQPDARRTFLLDIIGGNEDRHAGNFLTRTTVVDGAKVSRGFAIDNGMMFPPVCTLPRFEIVSTEHGFLLENELFTFDAVSIRQILKLDPEKLAKMLVDEGIESRAVEMSLNRLLTLKNNPNILREMYEERLANAGVRSYERLTVAEEQQYLGRTARDFIREHSGIPVPYIKETPQMRAIQDKVREIMQRVEGVEE